MIWEFIYIKRYEFDQKVKMIMTDSILIFRPPNPNQNVRNNFDKSGTYRHEDHHLYASKREESRKKGKMNLQALL